jgi:hypothetical protein
MEFKPAAAICLIALFSAALVVLIARALDMQAASRIEPQLAEIVKELRALRKSGGVPAGDAAEKPAIEDGLMVYYFHGAARCPTCRTIESQTYETVITDFSSPLEKGEIAWEVVDYDQSAGKTLAEKFQVSTASVVLAKMKSGKIENWSRLDQVWVLVGDKPAFAQYIRDEIKKMLEPAKKQAPASTSEDATSVPVPEEDTSGKK